MIRKEPLEDGLFLYRETEKPGYTTDSLLLIRFARLRKTDRVIDLGSGSGFLSIYGEHLYGCAFTGVEIDPAQAELASRSAEENGLAIPFFAMDVRDAPARFGEGAFTAAVCNPPYFGPSCPNPSPAFRAARHAEPGDPDAFLAAAFRLLRNRGRLFLCFPADAVSRACARLEAHRLTPKRMRRVRAAGSRAPYLILVEAVKLGGDGVAWEEDLLLGGGPDLADGLEEPAADAILWDESERDPVKGDGGNA